MPPVAAVSLVITLVLGAVLWIYLLRVCFADSAPLGIVALFLPPLALLALLPQWKSHRQLFALAVGVLGCISIAAILAA
ncbi:hypothetical protein [Microbulbifer pacificus]|uniref:Uncharacterized protein n=1 Tax=Microbulbifer pacificus TaxID=407164 RepID=A0AAU0MVF9_9GAMM|nr:hypothetical protein [Microbulbifer pacificus]WOX04127.1 hypothetical protein R5R33_10265 [Microbulbifer pacificus]